MAKIGDIAVIDGSGAYCLGMTTKSKNIFPESPEVLVDMDCKVHLIRKRKMLHWIYENKCDVPPAGVFGSPEAVTSEGVIT
jgi:diaminopimelate decarboxylase